MSNSNLEYGSHARFISLERSRSEFFSGGGSRPDACEGLGGVLRVCRDIAFYYDLCAVRTSRGPESHLQ